MSEETNNPVFSEDEKRALACVLDEIIPPGNDGKLPGAGELGLATLMEQTVRQTPGLRLVIEPGLSALDDLARKRGAGSFAALAKRDRTEVLAALASTDQAFLPTMLFHACVGYYQNDRVVEALGIEPRPPHPKGYEMEPGDLPPLDAVRRRGKMYREC